MTMLRWSLHRYVASLYNNPDWMMMFYLENPLSYIRILSRLIHWELLDLKLCSVSTVLFLSLTSNSHQLGNMAERLRRKIRNLLGSARAGSSPAVVVIFLTFLFFIISESQYSPKYIITSLIV